MSAHIIDAKLMDHVVWGFKQVNDILNLSKTGQALYKLNLDAVLQRYPNETKEAAPGPIDQTKIHENYEFAPQPDFSLINSWSAMGSLIYQCSEGDVPETDLYLKLKEAYYRLANVLLTEHSEYRSAYQLTGT